MPDLTRLLLRRLGQPPARTNPGYAGWANDALAVVTAGNVPVSLASAALGHPGTESWRVAQAIEQQRVQVRATTAAVVVAALGPLVRQVAKGGAEWRPDSGTDLDLLVPAPLLNLVTDRLAEVGLLRVPAHDEPTRRMLVRVEDGSVVDLVDLAVVSESDIAPGGNGWGWLTSEAARRRLGGRVTGRGSIRLVDRADAEELGVELQAPAARPTHPPSRSRRVVLLSGPGAEGEADRLAGNLRTAALDVVFAARPSIPRLVRAYLRHLRDGAVLVLVGPSIAPGAIRAEVPPGGLSNDQAIAVLRQVFAQSAGRRA